MSVDPVIPTMPFEVVFVISLVPFLLAVLGLVWALPAALVSGIVAGIKGLNVGRYVLAGAEHSLSLTVPWFYLMAEMILGRPPFSRRIVVAAYAVLLGLWIMGPIGLNIGILSFYLLSPFVLDVRDPALPTMISAFWAIILLVNVAACIKSIRDMRLRYRMARGLAVPSLTARLVQGYLTPFKLLALYSIVIVLLMYVVAFAVWGGYEA